MTTTNVMTSRCGFALSGGADQVHDAWATRARVSAVPPAPRKRGDIENGSKDKPWRLPV